MVREPGASTGATRRRSPHSSRRLAPSPMGRTGTSSLAPCRGRSRSADRPVPGTRRAGPAGHPVGQRSPAVPLSASSDLRRDLDLSRLLAGAGLALRREGDRRALPAGRAAAAVRRLRLLGAAECERGIAAPAGRLLARAAGRCALDHRAPRRSPPSAQAELPRRTRAAGICRAPHRRSPDHRPARGLYPLHAAAREFCRHATPMVGSRATCSSER